MFRALSRNVVCAPSDRDAHFARLKAAHLMPGAEPTQGALADFFYGCADATGAERRAVVDRSRSHLGTFEALAFSQYPDGVAFPACSSLATRWSVLVTPSLDAPRRALRCSPDDSREVARAAIEAWHGGDIAAQDAFLQHCWVCRDTLAFMLVRRTILKTQARLPEGWNIVFASLQSIAVSP